MHLVSLFPATLEQHVAFRAIFSAGSLHAPTSGPYKFDHTIFNQGNGYNAISGIFTAPISGVYTFSFQIYTQAAERPVTDIRVNGNVASRMSFDIRSPSSVSQSGMTTVIVSLSQKDQVWVEAGYGDSMYIYGGIHTFFSGVLLYPSE